MRKICLENLANFIFLFSLLERIVVVVLLSVQQIDKLLKLYDPQFIERKFKMILLVDNNFWFCFCFAIHRLQWLIKWERNHKLFNNYDHWSDLRKAECFLHQ